MSKDPLATLHTVYERFDLPFTSEAERSFTTWLQNPAQHKSSVAFSLEDFGLTSDEVEQAFGDYRERYGAFF
jgi:hypothetical protein